MNTEQIEAQLVDWLKTKLTVILPIRGTILQTFAGTLELEGKLVPEDNFNVFRLEFLNTNPPYTAIAFRAHDVNELRKKLVEDGGTENIILLSTEIEVDDLLANLKPYEP